MQRAGSVVKIAQGLLVVRATGDSTPDIGTRVVDEELTEVGHVVDIFGPIDSPYLSITPGDDVHPAALLNENLYIR